MSVISIVASVEAGNSPPRVRLDVTDTGSPHVFAATVTRLDPDGQLRPVRTGDGNPLALATSGSNRVGLLYDYEAPFGAPVSYSTLESPSVVSAEVTVPEDRVWLIHPGVPSLSIPVELRAGSMEEENLSVQRGVFYPMGRKHPVVQTDGARKAGESTITVAADTLAEAAEIRAIVEDAGTLLLNCPANLGLGIDTQYIAIGDVSIRRPSDVGTDPHRDVVMPFFVVDAPAGGSQAERTLADLLEYPTLSSLMQQYATFNDLLAGP